MTEKLFQFIWEKQYFRNTNLISFTGESIEIIDPGSLNTNQGPDFLNARIRLDSLVLAGSIELHLKTSDWIQHKHSADAMYGNVILHVVLENDLSNSPLNLPLLELKKHINHSLFDLYQAWNQSKAFVPCGQELHELPILIKDNATKRLILERLDQKAEGLIVQLEKYKFHWDEVLWHNIARSFGAQLNVESFQRLAESVSLTHLNRHRNNLIQLEAILLGRAGLLNMASNDAYVSLLQKEYAFLKTKYKWKDNFLPLVRLRMRPENFPEIRLAQLAKYVHENETGLHKLITHSSIQEVQTLLRVTANDFWHYHYTLSEASKFSPKQIGSSFANTIIVNAVIPMMYAYGRVMKNEEYNSKAIQWLEELPAEENKIIKGFSDLNWKPSNGLEAQALLQLKKSYCNHRQCLHCEIGQYLLKESAINY